MFHQKWMWFQATVKNKTQAAKLANQQHIQSPNSQAHNEYKPR